MSDVFYTRVLPILTGFGVAASVALAGATLPIVIAQGRDIQKLQDQMEPLRADVSKFEATADRLDRHMTETESDPSRVLAQVLGTTAANRKLGTSVVIGGNVFVFPKDEVAEGELARAGYTEKSITPTMSGYVASLPAKAPASDGAPVQRPGR